MALLGRGSPRSPRPAEASAARSRDPARARRPRRLGRRSSAARPSKTAAARIVATPQTRRRPATAAAASPAPRARELEIHLPELLLVAHGPLEVVADDLVALAEISARPPPDTAIRSRSSERRVLEGPRRQRPGSGGAGTGRRRRPRAGSTAGLTSCLRTSDTSVLRELPPVAVRQRFDCTAMEGASCDRAPSSTCPLRWVELIEPRGEEGLDRRRYDDLGLRPTRGRGRRSPGA